MCSCILCSRYRNTNPTDGLLTGFWFWCKIRFPSTNYSHASTWASFPLAARAQREQMRCWFTLPLVALLMEAEATINHITTHPEHRNERSLSNSIHLQQISSYFTQIIRSSHKTESWCFFTSEWFADAGLSKIWFLITLWNNHISEPWNKNTCMWKMASLCMSVKCGWQSLQSFYSPLTNMSPLVWLIDHCEPEDGVNWRLREEWWLLKDYKEPLGDSSVEDYSKAF